MRKGRALKRMLPALCVGVAMLGPSPAGAAAATTADPVWVFTAIPFYDPCGIGVDSKGDFYVSTYYPHHVFVYDGTKNYNPPPGRNFTDASYGLITQFASDDALDGPCGLSLNAADEVFLNDYHRTVVKLGTALDPGPGQVIAGPGADATHTTGVSVDPGSDRVYVDQRTFVGAYDATTGAPILEGGAPVRIGNGTLEDGYGVAVSTYPGTQGRLYVPDARSDEIEVYDPAVSMTSPIEEIDGGETEYGSFVSLQDASIAVDRVTGDIYVADDLQPRYTERPKTLIDVFAADGTYEGHLKFFVFNSEPVGLAVDNSEQPSQGRVYATSGNAEVATIYAYPPGAATKSPPVNNGKAVAISSTGGGTVRGDSGEIDCQPSCEAVVPVGTTISLTAEPATGSLFAGWSGACSGGAPECTVRIDEATSVLARFVDAPPAPSAQSPEIPAAPLPQPSASSISAPHVARHGHRHAGRPRRHRPRPEQDSNLRPTP